MSRPDDLAPTVPYRCQRDARKVFQADRRASDSIIKWMTKDESMTPEA